MEKRSCFECQLYMMCITRVKVDEAIKYTRVNIDGNATPGKYMDIIESLGNCCANFKKTAE